VVVLQEIFGVNSHIRAECDRSACTDKWLGFWSSRHTGSLTSGIKFRGRRMSAGG
jgi:hypothetical protein